jgi:hypothetical protein
MPLFKGKSKKTFGKNVATEMDAGKPQKQALAIAYAMKKKARKAYGGEMGGESDKWGSEAVRDKKMMAEGGPVDPIPDSRLQSKAHQCEMCGHVASNEEHESDRHDSAGEPMMAEGGEPSIAKESKNMHGGFTEDMGPTGPTGYKNRNKSSDMSGGQRRGPEGYPRYQESAQNEKGVHTPVSGVTQFSGGKGTSRAGKYTKETYAGKPLFSGKDHPAKKEHERVLSEMRSDKQDRRNLAEGGSVGPITEHNMDNYQSPSTRMHQTHDGDVDPQDNMTVMHQGNDVRDNARAMEEDERKLNQHGTYEEGRQGHESHYAEGGQITDNYADSEDGDGLDMVGQIMAQKQQEYSKGGQVANDTDRAKDATDPRDDMGSGRYDDLVNRADDMEDADYMGANSGDGRSDEREDYDRKDMVSKIMASRKKKDRLPNPR